MAKPTAPSLNAPIAGQSLTTEVGSRVWQQPPKYSTVEDALDYYMPRLNSPSVRNKMLDVLEMGVPVTTVVETMQMSGIMSGLHTIDVGMLATPVLMEMVAYIAEDADIDYDMGLDIRNEDNIDATKIALALRKQKNKVMQDEPIPEPAAEMLDEVVADVVDEEPVDTGAGVPVENTGGLMAMSAEDDMAMPEEQMPAKSGLMARRM